MGAKQLLAKALNLKAEYQNENSGYFSEHIMVLDSIITALNGIVDADEKAAIPELLEFTATLPYNYDGITRQLEPVSKVMKQLDLWCCLGYDGKVLRISNIKGTHP